MTAWRVGRATITPIVEVESVTSPRFLFKDLDKAGVLDIARRSPWLQGAFVDDGGYLLQRIQCLVVELDGVRVAVDTCVGNDKPPSEPRLERAAPPVPRRPRGGRLSRRHDRRRRVHAPARRPRGLEHDARRRPVGADVPEPRATCSHSPSSSTGRRRRFPTATTTSATRSRPWTRPASSTSFPSTMPSTRASGSTRHPATPRVTCRSSSSPRASGR